MSSFGDADPEDAYDADDAPAVKLVVLARLATALEAPQVERLGVRVAWALVTVARLRLRRELPDADLASLQERFEAVAERLAP